MNSLVGYTGFVGSNINASGKFDGLYNSENIQEAFGTEPELLIYAGLRAEKFLANHDPAKDMNQIIQAEENILKINPKKLVLISTIDVFKIPSGVDEYSAVNTKGLHAYGFNRYQLELWVREHFEDALIVRLPALFGKGIKKNFIYDYMNYIPSMLKTEKFEELAKKNGILKKYYVSLDNGFYKLQISAEERNEVREVFENLGFSALNFTDSRSRFQFYNLKYLWEDIQMMLDVGAKIWHPAAEPVSAAEIYRYLTGKTFKNEITGNPAYYDYHTVYSVLFGRNDGYISDKESVLQEIKDFTEGRLQNE